LKKTIGLCTDLVACFHVWRYRLLFGYGLINFALAAESIAAIPLVFGYRVRERFYRAMLAECGPRLKVNYGATINEIGCRIGSDVWIGSFSYIDLAEIGDQVLIAPQVCILAGGKHHRTDRLDIPIRLQGNNPLRPTRIGHGAWVGANSVVMADVGDGSIIGAGAVVTKPVPPLAVVAGNPARIIRYRQ
jgi:virginiamycin A acetyltransferase